MFKKSILATALAAAFVLPACASAAENKELNLIRQQMQQMKDAYEARMAALEKRLEIAEAKGQQVSEAVNQPAVSNTYAAATTTAAIAAPAIVNQASASPAPGKIAAAANAFNPAVALNLTGTMSNLSQDPKEYKLQGFMPTGGEVGPGARSFSLGESELTLSANIDTNFSGQLTFALAADDKVSVEEAFFQSKALLNGSNLKVGRFLSSIGYLNNQHAHTWDFVDAPLAYQAFFGGQYKPDGLQFKWLAPTDQFLEFGVELGNGANFPGNDRNKNGFGASALFAHLGDDLGENASWRAGLSYLSSSAKNRGFEEAGQNGATVNNAFSGNSKTWIADAIFKWAPDGNSTQRNFKLQGEYFHRDDSGSLSYDSLSSNANTGSYASAQSGWYLQGVYQFMPQWRVGLRYDRLNSGTPLIGLVENGSLSAADFPTLQSYNPKRSSIMFDYSLSEFSRFRLQFARDNSRPGVTDNQIFLQYNMSLGAHGAHNF
ncbi:hypothetical protein [Undibacterium sp.]|uniref:hypothetical protein n=1 Tax=Undibacterium sp. TaxID=1914977 RepID=UPI0025D625E6|nr:hypothetical protein [Undibacterium sp.]